MNIGLSFAGDGGEGEAQRNGFGNLGTVFCIDLAYGDRSVSRLPLEAPVCTFTQAAQSDDEIDGVTRSGDARVGHSALQLANERVAVRTFPGTAVPDEHGMCFIGASDACRADYGKNEDVA